MEIDPAFRPDTCVSKDATKPHMTHVLLDVEHKCIVASDDHCLVRVPVASLDEDDTTGLVSREVLMHARKVAKSMKILPRVVLNERAHIGPERLMTIGRSDAPTGTQFPPYEQVIPNHRDPEADYRAIGVDIELLYRAAMAIGPDRTHRVTLYIPKNQTDPIVVTPCGGHATMEGAPEPLAVVMPMM